MAELPEDEAPPSAAAASTFPAQAETDSVPPLAPKRQRRPSVRLGDIGEQPATVSTDSHLRRVKTKLYKDPSLPSKSSKIRPLTNLVNGADYQEPLETEDTGNFDSTLIVSRKSKRAITAKRSKLNWASKSDNNAGDSDEKLNCRNDDGEFRDFEPEGSVKERSSPNLVENVALDSWNGGRRQFRARNLDDGDEDAVEMGSDGLNLSEGRDLKCGTSEERSLGREGSGKRGFLSVRSWLVELGLERYAPVFDIHEVDDEVLPFLTLEDLKDMGIGAVGSRRKMIASIQRLRKSLC